MRGHRRTLGIAEDQSLFDRLLPAGDQQRFCCIPMPGRDELLQRLPDDLLQGTFDEFPELSVAEKNPTLERHRVNSWPIFAAELDQKTNNCGWGVWKSAGGLRTPHMATSAYSRTTNHLHPYHFWLLTSYFYCRPPLIRISSASRIPPATGPF